MAGHVLVTVAPWLHPAAGVRGDGGKDWGSRKGAQAVPGGARSLPRPRAPTPGNGVIQCDDREQHAMRGPMYLS